MFWGTIIAAGKTWKSQNAFEDGEFPVLHISMASLSRACKTGDKVYLIISDGKNIKELTLCSLQKDK